jgi:hypothetical protein
MRISTTVTLSMLGILILAVGSASAADPTPATATTTPPAATAKPVNVIDGDKVVCKTLAQTGTRFTKKVCLTKAEWFYEHTSAMDALRNKHPLDRRY